MNLQQAIRGNDERRQREKHRRMANEIRATQIRINRLYAAMPYCAECGHLVLRRDPCEHKRAAL